MNPTKKEKEMNLPKRFSLRRFIQTALTSIDSYKLGHADQYPFGTTKVYSNFTPRNDFYLNLPSEFKTGKIVWFGLQLFLCELKEIWDETFFKLPKDEVIDEFVELVAPFVGPKGYTKERIAALYDLGYLPLEIKAIPEGSRVNIGVPVLTITNTRAEEFWLPNFLETWMSSELWQASTSATIAYGYRCILNKYVELTGSNKDFSNWQLHDFSVRGMGGIVSAAKSGAGHLLSSLGTDSIPAVKAIRDVYDGKNTFVGGSVPATEHSVMCAGGKESEIETFRRLIQTYPSGVLSIVSDTWDYWNVLTNLAVQLKEEILARVPDSLGLAKVVFRPDSGDPVKIICGYKVIDEDQLNESWYDAYDEEYEVVKTNEGKFFLLDPTYDRYDGSFDGFVYGKEISEAAAKGSVEVLFDIFGGTTNEKGFKTLNQRVGLIYGDSITPTRCEQILDGLMQKGFAADNIVFGIGSYTYQYNTRDTLGFAMKATYVELNGEGTAIFKDPKTDNGTKKSARGLLCVRKNGDDYVLINDVPKDMEAEGELQRVFLNGEIYRPETYELIRQRLGAM